MVGVILSQMSELLSLEEAVLQVLRRDEVLSNFDAIVNIPDLKETVLYLVHFTPLTVNVSPGEELQQV